MCILAKSTMIDLQTFCLAFFASGAYFQAGVFSFVASLGRPPLHSLKHHWRVGLTHSIQSGAGPGPGCLILWTRDPAAPECHMWVWEKLEGSYPEAWPQTAQTQGIVGTVYESLGIDVSFPMGFGHLRAKQDCQGRHHMLVVLAFSRLREDRELKGILSYMASTFLKKARA